MLTERRHHETRAKARARIHLKRWNCLGDGPWNVGDRHHNAMARRVGMKARTPCACSCACCGNPRRNMGERTHQELKAND